MSVSSISSASTASAAAQASTSATSRSYPKIDERLSKLEGRLGTFLSDLNNAVKGGNARMAQHQIDNVERVTGKLGNGFDHEDQGDSLAAQTVQQVGTMAKQMSGMVDKLA